MMRAKGAVGLVRGPVRAGIRGLPHRARDQCLPSWRFRGTYTLDIYTYMHTYVYVLNNNGHKTEHHISLLSLIVDEPL